jgi:hypothetical protein
LEKSENNYKLLYLLPLSFIVGIVPLIVYLKKIPLSQKLMTYWPNKFNWDYFAYYKMIFLLLATFIALISLFIYLFNNWNKFKKTYYYIPLGIYAFFIILSTLVSKHPKIALWGFMDHYEGMFTLLAYLIITVVTINLVNNREDVKFLVGSLIISASVLGILGLFQYFGFDLLTTKWGQLLILPTDLHHLVGKIPVHLSDYTTYLTLQNPNFVGSYMVMLFTFSFVLYICVEDKKYKLLSGAFTILMFANWLASRSRAGMIGGFFATILLGVLLYRRIIEDWKYILGILICFSLVFAGMNYVAQGELSQELLSFGSQAKMAMQGGEVSDLQDIKINGRELEIITETESIRVFAPRDKNFIFYNENNNKISYSQSRYPDPYVHGKYVKIIKLHNQQYKDYHFIFIPHKNILHFEYDKTYGKKRMAVNFKINSTGFWIEYKKGDLVRPKDVEIRSWGFEDRERLGSGRGYIWSRSLPLLTNTLVKGYGPDTYAIYFPQYDYVGKLKTWGTPKRVVDKPHNLYLQIALNTGIISLIAVVILFGVYFFSSVRIYWNENKNNIYMIVGLGVLIALSGYLVTAFFNDSVISVAPVFWVLLGLGISINLKLKLNNSPELTG